VKIEQDDIRLKVLECLLDLVRVRGAVNLGRGVR